MIQEAVDTMQPGDILVVSPNIDSDFKSIGNILANSIKKQGDIGVITEASVRDI